MHNLLFPLFSARASFIRCCLGSAPLGTLQVQRSWWPWARASCHLAGLGDHQELLSVAEGEPWQQAAAGYGCTSCSWLLLSSVLTFAFLPCSLVLGKMIFCYCGPAGPKHSHTPTHVLSLCCVEVEPDE